MKGNVSQRPAVIAHRGFSSRAAENTRTAFELAIAAGADGVECDVRLSRDGHAVVIHDPDVARMSNGRGHVADLTLAELKALRWGDERATGPAPGPPPVTPIGTPDGAVWRSREFLTLAELIDLIMHAGRGVRLLIETKHSTPGDPELDRAVALDLRRVGWDRPNSVREPSPVTLISFSAESLDRLAGAGLANDRILLLPEAPPAGAGDADQARDRRDQVMSKQLMATGIITGLGPSLNTLRDKARLEAFGWTLNAGMELDVWVANTIEEIDFCVDCGATMVSSDNPELALARVAERAAGSPPGPAALFRDASLPSAQRAADLLSHMTLEEKVGQMLQLDVREGVEIAVLALHAGSILHASPERVREAHAAAARTRLAIPLLIADDAIHGHSFWEGATIFPTQLALAATWNTGLVERIGRATAVEAAATGLHWTFSPVVCLARDQRWGRIGETFGEDPHLVGELASALMLGYQGSGPADREGLLATAKHYAGYSETQGGRDASEADLSRRKLRSWFLPPFERLARAGCASFMMGYQAIDGVPVTVNGWLLKDVLRDEWAYTGLMVTDWDNVGRMVWEQKTQPDLVHAAAASVTAGCDVIMATPGFYWGALEAVRVGLLDESAIDAAVMRILTLKFTAGLFEDAREPDLDLQRRVVASPAHADLNLEAARRSLVLLRNDGALPLDGQTGGSIAVVGPLAHSAQTQLGDWAGNSGQVDWLPGGQPRAMISTVLDGLAAVAPPGWEITFAPGAQIVSLAPDPAGPVFPDGQPRPPVPTPIPPDPAQLAQALALARQADLVVAVVGDQLELAGEGRSTATLELMGGQIALLDALAEAGTPRVVVLLASKPLVLPASALSAQALIWAASPGMRGGQALAELIFGDIEPSGRLPMSFARHAGQLPVYYQQIRGQHGIRYADLTQEPAFAFGEGLSYSTIEYSGLRLEAASIPPSGCVCASVRLSNVGTRPTRETVQAYIRDLVTSVTWAVKELKAFAQVDLAPGQSRIVELEIPASACSLVDADGRRVVEPGDFELLVGRSSRDEDLLRTTFQIGTCRTPNNGKDANHGE